MGSRCEDALWSGQSRAAEVAMAYLVEHRKLAEDSVREFGIGLYVNPEGKPLLTDGRPWLTIPLRDETGAVVNMKFRSVPVVGSCEHCKDPLGCRKCKRYRHCAGRPLPLFGSHTLRELGSDDVVHVVEGELDVVAAHTYGWPVGWVSGTAGAGTWLDEWLDLLEEFQAFVGAMDDDEQGSKGWAKFVELMGKDRCAQVRLPHNDLGACLQQGVSAREIREAVERAEPMVGVQIKSVDEYADAIEELILNPEVMRGVTTGSGYLDRLLGGIRPELIVVSGETGEGKTTFTTWLAWQLAHFGHRVAIAPLEQSPLGDVQKLLRMELGGDFTLFTPEQRRAAYDRFSSLPLRILDYDGHMSLETCVEIIRYCRRRQGIRFFVVDHLHFVVDPSIEDKTGAVEDAVRTFALLVKELTISIFLVVHPKNTQRGPNGKYQRVTDRDLKGASAIRQDAATILIVEKLRPEKPKKGDATAATWPRSNIHCDKMRSEFGVQGGCATMAFDLYSCIYADTWEDTPSGAQGRTLVVPDSGS